MPLPSTYIPIATNTLGSAVSNITFSNIPSTYTDLKIVCAITSTAGNNNFVLFNGDGGANYSSTYMQGTGSAAQSGRASSAAYGYVDYSGTTGQHTITVDILNYANTTTYKSYLSRGGDTGTVTIAYAGTWRNTAAITSVLFGNGAANGLLAGTTITLYGIKAA